jgi:hypothetical protein
MTTPAPPMKFLPRDPARACGVAAVLAEQGLAARETDQPDAARDAFARAAELYRHATELDPHCVPAWWGLGRVLSQQGRCPAALEVLDRAARLAPDCQEIGDERRGVLYTMPPDGWARTVPFWDGGPVAVKTVLVYDQAENFGLGDVVWTAWTAVELHRRGARVILACRQTLQRLFSYCPAVAAVAALDGQVPSADLCTTLGAAMTILGNPKADGPYLSAESTSVNRWRAELDSMTPPGHLRVGICWHAKLYIPYREDWRAIPLAYFADLAAVPAVTLFSLQKGDGSEQLAGARFPVHDLGRVLETGLTRPHAFIETAAVLVNLDLLVTVDTAMAHVAGALGVPTWLLLGTRADSRWGPDHRPRQLYPGMRQFRVSQHENWSRLFQALAAELAMMKPRSA